MNILINVLISDHRFYRNEVEWALEEAKRFFGQYGIDLSFIWRLGLYHRTRGHVLRFTSPDGSHAKGRIAEITLNDWITHPHWKSRMIIHELNHTVFGCPDHYYEGSSRYEPCSELCIMHSLDEVTLCSKCLTKVESAGKINLFPIIVTVIAFSTPIWFPLLLKWLSGRSKSY